MFILLALVAAQSARLGMAGFSCRWHRTKPTIGHPGPEAWRGGGLPRCEIFLRQLGYASDNPWALEAQARRSGEMRASKFRARRSPPRGQTCASARRCVSGRPRPSCGPISHDNLNETDGELFAALRHADELGPWEPSVQQTTLFVGLAVWRDLDPALRQALARTVERGASRNAKKMFEIVKSYTRFDLICAIEKYQPIAAADCRKAAETAKKRPHR